MGQPYLCGGNVPQGRLICRRPSTWTLPIRILNWRPLQQILLAWFECDGKLSSGCLISKLVRHPRTSQDISNETNNYSYNYTEVSYFFLSSLLFNVFSCCIIFFFPWDFCEGWIVCFYLLVSAVVSKWGLHKKHLLSVGVETPIFLHRYGPTSLYKYSSY